MIDFIGAGGVTRTPDLRITNAFWIDILIPSYTYQ
jgi:hypothetical protein